MANPWYYVKDGRQCGPVSDECLKQLAATSQLQPVDLVWKDGMAQWVPAHRVNGLFKTPEIPLPPPLYVSGHPPYGSPCHSDAGQWRDRESTALIAAGYICAGLSLLIFPPAFGLAGIVCGIVNLVRGNIVHGIVQIVLSVILSFVGMCLGVALGFEG